MPTIDELGRAAAAQLRSEVHVDADAGLRRLHSPAPAVAADRRRWWALGGAAAVVLLAVAAFVVIDRSPTRHSPTTNPTSVAPTLTPSTTVAPAPSTAPATTAATTTTAATAVASTTAAPTTSGAPTTSPATTTVTAAPSYDLTVFAAPPTIDLPPLLVDLPLPGCDPNCPSVASTADGTLVVFDGDTQTFALLPIVAAEPTIVALQAPGWTGDWLVAIGPDDVAYVFVHPEGSNADGQQDLVAVPLRGPNAGTVVARTPGVGDISGDTDYVATERGIVAVFCCDDRQLRPPPERAAMMGWVDAEGTPTAGTGTYLTLDFTPGYSTVTRSDSATLFEVTEIFDTDFVRGMPRLAARADGSVLVATWPIDGTQWRVANARPDGSVELVDGLPDGNYVLAVDQYGVIVVDSTRVARWQLPGYGEAMPLDPARLVDGTFASVDDAVDAILTDLRAPDGCEVVPTAELTGTEARTTWTIARFTAREGCDDSIAGRAIAVALTPRADGRWTASAAIQAALCRRGVSDGACV